jgi:2-oxo-4-hydroxy-4-carboxy-5-ureidoimidazoline decarboxylase
MEVRRGPGLTDGEAIGGKGNRMTVAAGRPVRPDEGLAVLAALSPDRAEAELSACCAATRWVGALAARRPFETVDALYTAAAEELAGLDWPEVLEALGAHPRIGAPAAGPDAQERWSRAEQAGAADADASTAAALAAANADYEAKFGFVFLIRATGRTAEQMLAAALGRLGHDEPTERLVVRDELAQIVRLRLDRMLEGLRPGADPQ